MRSSSTSATYRTWKRRVSRRVSSGGAGVGDAGRGPRARCGGRTANVPARCRPSFAFRDFGPAVGGGRGGGPRSVPVVGGVAALVSSRRRSPCGRAGRRRVSWRDRPARTSQQKDCKPMSDEIPIALRSPDAVRPLGRRRASGSSPRGGRWCAAAGRWGRSSRRRSCGPGWAPCGSSTATSSSSTICSGSCCSTRRTRRTCCRKRSRRPRSCGASIRRSTIEPIVADVTHENVAALADDVDVIVDGTDNFATRFLVNDYCVKHGTPVGLRRVRSGPKGSR